MIAASGTLAQIIPPSLVLIVLADQLGRSVGDMYTGALIPGLMLAGFYAVFVFIVTMIRKEAAPGLPPEAIVHREPNGARGYGSLVVVTAVCAEIDGVVAYRSVLERLGAGVRHSHDLPVRTDHGTRNRRSFQPRSRNSGRRSVPVSADRCSRTRCRIRKTKWY